MNKEIEKILRINSWGNLLGVKWVSVNMEVLIIIVIGVGILWNKGKGKKNKKKNLESYYKMYI